MAAKSKTIFNGTWSFTTYFAEGFPFEIIRTVLAFFLRTQRVALENIGLTSLLGIPWTIKFLWGPQVDEYGTRRTWLLGMQGILAVLFLLVAFFAETQNGLPIIMVIMLFAAFLAATHDIAIDGYYLAALDRQEQAKFVGWRVMAYRLAMLFGQAGIIKIGVEFSWRWAFLASAVTMGLLTLWHHFILPRPESPQRPMRELFRAVKDLRFLIGAAVVAALIVLWRASTTWQPWQAFLAQHPVLAKVSIAQIISLTLLLILILLGIFRKRVEAWLLRRPDSFYAQAFTSFIHRENMAIILGFVIFLRAGEYMQGSLISSYFIDLGLKQDYSMIAATVGLPATILGAIFGGWLIGKFSFKKMFLPLICAQNFTMLIYVIVAAHLNPFIQLNTGVTDNALLTYMGDLNFYLVVIVHGIDNFTSGLGTSVLTVFLLRICLPQYKAAHYAIASGLMSVFGILGGVYAGQCAQHFGYAVTYLVSFWASVPGLICAWMVWRKVLPGQEAALANSPQH